MIRNLILAAPLALGLSVGAFAADQPPPEYVEYVAAVRKADAIADPLQRCLAYPDLPGNTWPAGTAKARCVMFLTPEPYTLDSLEAALAKPGGAAAVDATFQALLDAHFTVPDKREHVYTALLMFRGEDRPKAERVARAWLSASPRSAFAHAALGHSLSAQGWEARGGKYIQETPRENIERMDAFFARAAKEYEAALDLDPKLYPACVSLMSIGSSSSAQVEAWATSKCIEIDPASYYVVDQMMNGAEPRWGGSDAQMRAVAAYANARVAQNPVLAVFSFHHAYYPIERSTDSDPEAIAILEPAARQVPNAAYLREVGGAYMRKKEYWKAISYLSQALRFSPDYATESRFRAWTLVKLGEVQWARADAERAVELDPDNGYSLRVLGDIVRELDGPAAAIPYFQRASKDKDTREHALNDLCGSLIDARRSEEAKSCVDTLLAEFPDNPEGWRQRLIVIGFEAPGSMEALRRFIALNDPKRWSRHADAARKYGQVLAAKEGKASPEDLFASRVTRANWLERTPEGRAYVMRLAPAFYGASREISACLDGMPPGGFTAVMDVLSNGTIANVAVAPVNKWTSCYAKATAASVKAPAPPEAFAEKGFPLVIEMTERRR